jgi:hypothetical protein
MAFAPCCRAQVASEATKLPPVARIRGVAVHPDGSPALGAIEIEPVDAGNPTAVALISDSDGSFATEKLPAGRYRVGVDLGINVQPDEAYGRTYYPGTPDAANAIEIQIATGQPEPAPILFTVPKLRPTVRIQGRVIFEDGTPAARVDVLFSPVGGYATAQIYTDSKGNFTDTKYGSVAYRIRSSSRDAKFESEMLVVQAADLEEPILLVLHKASLQTPKQL